MRNGLYRPENGLALLGGDPLGTKKEPNTKTHLGLRL